ncbi:MAG: ferrous iron transporter B [Ruminococcus sp.]|nr:ferrous iron transporter B [Ruminococcus sp.]
MGITIALAGNPNCGKTTLFNALTGSNQYVGNWPGVTVEKKEGKLKGHSDVTITDLPGIYSLSPYTLEEVVARNYLIDERPDAILNIIDGTNLERNLYLTTQLVELGIPVVGAVNMMDIVNKKGDEINLEQLSKKFGCRFVTISALKEEGILEAAEAAIEAAQGEPTIPQHGFSGPVEHALAHIEEAAVHDMDAEKQRWYAIKIFERDQKVIERLGISGSVMSHIEEDIAAAERELDDDAESIITNERYNYITSIIRSCYKKQDPDGLSTSDKIDMVLTNRWLGLPIFAVIMFLVYYLSMVTVGARANDWASNGVFGEGWHLLGIGSSAASDAEKEYGDTDAIITGLLNKADRDGIDTTAARAAIDTEAKDFDAAAAEQALLAVSGCYTEDTAFSYKLEDAETLEVTNRTASVEEFNKAAALFSEYGGKVDPSKYGVWVPGVPVIIEKLLGENPPAWLRGLIIDGIVAGVGSVLGFVPQMLVLFLLLAFLEACGYMSRIAFVLDRLFRKFGLSGKSFIPMLVGVGCGVPGIMASRTIENERDRRMTIMTTTFIPCGAKVPFIGMIAGSLFGGSALVSTSAYFIGMAAIIVSGLMLKKTRLFAGDPAPFVMELPAYHMPTAGSVLRAMWERGWSFIKKAGTVILLSTVLVWFLSRFGWGDSGFGMLSEDRLDQSILAKIGGGIAWIFTPLGWGKWQTAVASFAGLLAKENIVGVMGTLYGGGDQTAWEAISTVFTGVTGYSFMIFNLLCAPCFAAIAAIRREMNSARWTWFAIGYQCTFAYAIALCVTSFGNLLTGRLEGASGICSLIGAILVVCFLGYMLFRKDRNGAKN